MQSSVTGCYRCNKHAVESNMLVGNDKLEQIPQRLYLGDMLSAVGHCKLADITRCNILGTGSVNFYSYQSPFDPRHEISNNVVCATSKGSDQPAHMRSLIRAFASHLNILCILSY